MTSKDTIYHLFLTFYTYNKLFRTSFGIFHHDACDVTNEMQSFDVTFIVACELSQPMGKTEFSSIPKSRTNSVSQVRKIFQTMPYTYKRFL